VVDTPRIVVAGTHSGVGKTTIASGLMAALSLEGFRVAPFKVGPDFIDPSYHTLAAGRPGRNLDAFLSGPDLIAPLFAHGAQSADIAVIEGAMGLFDGKGGGDLASTAHVARLLQAPIVLVVDARAMARSAAAMVHGYTTFDPKSRVAGVVLNRVGSRVHESMLREALRPLGIPVLGVLRRDDDVQTPYRHLGLVPVAERREEATRSLHALGKVTSRSLNLDGIVRLARSAEPLVVEPWSPESPDLDRSCGTDALYLGGGFPETYTKVLSTNGRMRESVRAFAAGGRPVVAECGGLLYLVRELDGHRMCGVLDAEATMTDRLTLGYREARALADSPLAERGASVRGHEFHYSAVETRGESRPAWDLIGRGQEGFVAGGVHASFLHTHWAAVPELPRRLVLEASQGATEVGV
jgi:cobyrinic acid a,c-diamide synthase